MGIRSVTVRLAGTVGDDAIGLEVAGSSVAIAADRSFSVAIPVPAQASSIGMTVIGADGRRSSRRVQVRRFGHLGGAA